MYAVIAAVSYPAFLLHPLLIILVYLFQPFSKTEPPEVPQLIMLLFLHLAIATGCSFLMHVVVEWPFMRLGKKVEDKLFNKGEGGLGGEGGMIGLMRRRRNSGIKQTPLSPVNYEQLSLYNDDDSEDDNDVLEEKNDGNNIIRKTKMGSPLPQAITQMDSSFEEAHL